MSEFKENIETKTNSEVSFGYLMTILLFIFSGFLYYQHHVLTSATLILAMIFLLLTKFMPKKLTYLNTLWFRLGLYLGKIISPIIIACIYIFSILPTALLMAMFRKDPLNLKIDTQAETYWIKRENLKQNMKDQF